MRQYLVRHGESVSNLEGRVQGQADVELSELGHAQARRVADWISGGVGAAGEGGGAIGEFGASPLKRARETDAVIAAAVVLPVRVEDRLAELHAGIFQGHLWADLEAAFPDEVARWRSGDVD
ncbi:MAG: histidine phosphatase family protein, partial [Planctomycetia bacterium]